MSTAETTTPTALPQAPPTNAGACGGQAHRTTREPKEQLDMTREEFDRIKNALKHEEFRKLFMDYCAELQDPENRRQYEEEIKQFEAERGVDVTFINPKPGFVVKTSVDGSYKCFINIAHNELVDPPTSTPASGGHKWSLPMTSSPARDDVDAQRKHCKVYDVVFHTQALDLAKQNPHFKKLLVETALDNVEQQFKVKLDRTNLKYPKLDFKGIARPTIIRKLAKNASAEAQEPHPLDAISPPKPKANAEPTVLPLKKNFVEQPKHNVPKYTIKHRRGIDFTEFTQEADAKLNVTLPHELIVEIELPLLKSAAECALDVTDKAIYMNSDKPGAMYKLRIDLPYAVNDKEGSARFDKDTRRLCITLPVVQANAEKQREMHDKLLTFCREDSGVGSECSTPEVKMAPEELLEESSEKNALVTEIETANEAAKQDVAVNAATEVAEHVAETFLQPDVAYKFPSKTTCNILGKDMSFVLSVHNVDASTVKLLQSAHSVHMQFQSIGAGFYPCNYAFLVHLAETDDCLIQMADAEVWNNNVVLTLKFNNSIEHIDNYFAGTNVEDLKPFKVRRLQSSKRNENMSSKPAPLDVSVEHLDEQSAIEIEIKTKTNEKAQNEKIPLATSLEEKSADEKIANEAKKCENAPSSPKDIASASSVTAPCADLNNQEPTTQNQRANRKLNRSNKKQNRKQRSFSATAYEDIKAYQKQQQQVEEEQPKTQQQDRADTWSSRQERRHSDIQQSDIKSASIASSSGSVASSCKGILKHYTCYPITAAESLEELCPPFARSLDANCKFPVTFNADTNNEKGLSESCKKSVRFADAIKKFIFRSDASILGQRKKNQKRRNLKQRTLQRRLSEGDSTDYEPAQKLLDTDANAKQNQNVSDAAVSDEDYDSSEHFDKPDNNNNNNVKSDSDSAMNSNHHNSHQNRHKNHRRGSSNGNGGNGNHGGHNKNGKNKKKNTSPYVDNHKNAMIFDMDM